MIKTSNVTPLEFTAAAHRGCRQQVPSARLTPGFPCLSAPGPSPAPLPEAGGEWKLAVGGGRSGQLWDVQAVLTEPSPMGNSTFHRTSSCWRLLLLSHGAASWDYLPIKPHPSPRPQLCFHERANEDPVIQNVHFFRAAQGHRYLPRLIIYLQLCAGLTCCLGSFGGAFH